MPIGPNIQAWRVSRGRSLLALATKAGLPVESLEAIETGQADPSLSMLEAVASALGVPPSWLHGDPKHLELLTADSDGEESELPSVDSIDPVIGRILNVAQHERELYVLLTRLLQAGDPKLIRAAEVSLRSLVKQAKQATVPWQNRPPGHFEPPSD
ncbi:MAG TPA: helix-turn-helix transcriptional regulator [Nitrospiraceae bacterium]|nr:helix-turn-helix transcriptional regulator [Nitrospiraceae bacterium]